MRKKEFTQSTGRNRRGMMQTSREINLEEIMEHEMFITAERVAKDFGVSRAKAYNMVRQLNEELKEQGYLTVPGRVSKQYYLERTYGLSPQMEG